ncbi:AAA family ATPase [Breznakiellaceae bacterium SP9]
MITNLKLKNFKAFEDEAFEFGMLNILSGLNNSGKSSVIQSLRLLKEQKPLPELGPLSGYIRKDTKCFNLQCSQTEINDINTTFSSNVVFSFDSNDCRHESGRVNGIVSYISADRLGPRSSLPLSIDDSVATVGNKGENVVDLLSYLDNDWSDLRIPKQLVAKEGSGVNENIKEWLRVISPGIDFKYDSDRHTDIGRTEFNGHRPVHVGFGLSYTLPIIVSILIHASQLAKEKTDSVLLMIENPEAHLHPSGQTKMGEMLVFAASCGVQIVVETHSDHLLNGIRIAVKNGKIKDPKDVKCFFFDAGKDEEPTRVNRISIDKHGMLDYWPEGFFDETEKSLMQLV